MTTYGVLGVGSIAEAMVVGLCEGVAEPPRVVLSPRGAERASALADRFATVRVAEDNQAVVDACDTILVCLRRADADEVLAGLRWRPDQAVLSAVAGLSLARLAELCGPATALARSVPLPSVAARASVTVVHPGTAEVVALFDRLGGSAVVDDEAAFESVSVASATVATYFRYLGTVADWLAERGIAPEQSRRYVADLFSTLAGELASPSADFDSLSRAHATPGGLNEQLVERLGEAGVFDEVRSGLDAVLARIAPR